MAMNKQGTYSGRHARNANAIGSAEMPMWRVTGRIMTQTITARVPAANKDEAMKKAHDRRITVATCEIAKSCPTNATRR